jgi:hypothetical protein
MVLIWLLGACLDPRSAGALADSCAGCHVEQGEALAASAHGPGRSALFRAARSAAPPGACDTCHAPEPGLHPGLGCTTCHAAVGHQGEGSGLPLLDWGGPVQGPTGAAGGPHDTVQSDFLGAADLCATCHTVEAPVGFSEHTPAEWREGPAAAAGQTCQGCHLQGHRFVGLQSDGVALLQATLGIEADPDGVVLHNRSPGHGLPTGAAWARALRLVFDTGEAHELGPALTRRGAEVHDPLRADSARPRALGPLERRRWPWPPGARSACVLWWPLHPGVAEAYALTPTPPEEVGCAAR